MMKRIFGKTQFDYNTTDNTASTSAPAPTSNRAPKRLSPAKMEQALNEWAKGAAPGENRIEAKTRILEAYTSGTDTLTLWQLGLTTLPKEIGNLATLTYLSLDNNQLTSLPTEIGKLTALTTLRLYGNQLTTLPKEIGNLAALTVLGLKNNQLTTLPQEIGNLAALTTLHLNDNQLTTLPQEIGKLAALTELDLSNNQISTLPQAIGNLAALTELVLSNNPITTLPKEIGNLAALTKLNLWSNQLTNLPKEIGNLTKLTELILEKNQLIALPKEIGKLTALTRLELYGNNLTTLPKEIGNLTALTELSLDNNQLTTLPKEIGNLATLTDLGLGNNQLATLPITLKTFWETHRLKKLLFERHPKTCLERYGKVQYIEEPTTLNLPVNDVQALMQLLPQHIGDGKLAVVPNGERIHTSAVLPDALANQANCYTFFVNFERAMHYLHAKHMAHANEYSNVEPASWSKVADLVLKQVPLLHGLGNVFGALSKQQQESVHANKGQRFLAMFHTPLVFAEAMSHAGVQFTMRLQHALVTDPSTLLKNQQGLLKRVEKTCETVLQSLNLKPNDVFAGAPVLRLAKQMAVLSAKVLIKNPPEDLESSHTDYAKNMALYLVNQVLGHQPDILPQDEASTSAVNATETGVPEPMSSTTDEVPVQKLQSLQRRLSAVEKKMGHLENREALLSTQQTVHVNTHLGLNTVDHLGRVEPSGYSANVDVDVDVVLTLQKQVAELQANRDEIADIREVTLAHEERLSDATVSLALQRGFSLGHFTPLVALYLRSFHVDGLIDSKEGKTRVLLKGHNPLRLLKGGPLEKWVDLSEALRGLHGQSANWYCANVDLNKLVGKMPDRFARTVSMRLPENWNRFARLIQEA